MTTVRVASVCPSSGSSCSLLAAAGTWEFGGGFRATCREVATTPFSLAARMSGHVTPVPEGPFTSHASSLAWGGRTLLSVSAASCHGAITAPGRA